MWSVCFYYKNLATHGHENNTVVPCKLRCDAIFWTGESGNRGSVWVTGANDWLDGLPCLPKAWPFRERLTSSSSVKPITCAGWCIIFFSSGLRRRATAGARPELDLVYTTGSEKKRRRLGFDPTAWFFVLKRTISILRLCLDKLELAISWRFG